MRRRKVRKRESMRKINWTKYVGDHSLVTTINLQMPHNISLTSTHFHRSTNNIYIIPHAHDYEQ